MTQGLPGHEAISASAGSGKTFQLAHRYIRLLAAGVEPDRIAALTFSRKAAGEIFDSIVGYLCDAAQDDRAAHVMNERLHASGLSTEDYTAMLRRLLRLLHRLHIGTLDSFTVGIIRTFPFELGIPPAVSLMEADGAEAFHVQQRTLASLYRSENGVQESPGGMLEEFAQATFGRSEKKVDDHLAGLISQYHTYYRLLPDRVAWGKPEAIWPEGNRWLNGDTDVARAAAVLERSLVEAGVKDKVLQRFRDFAQAARAFTPRSAWTDPLKFLFPRLLAASAKLRDGSAEVMTDRVKTLIDGEAASATLALIAHVVRIHLTTAINRTQGAYAVIDRYNRAYERVIRATGSLTFEDAQFLLSGANRSSNGARLSRERGEEGRLFIDYRLDAGLDHWLLDEFQDTSDLQWDILSNLAEETLQDSSGQRSFFFVGDVKQAIYGWRGGNPRLFGMLLDRYSEVISTRELAESRRSCPPVIDMVNAAFGKLTPGRLPDRAVSRWRRFWQPHRSAEGPAQLAGVAMLLEPPCDGGECKPTKEDRYRIVAGLLNDIEPLSRGLSAAVLVRSNADGKAVVDYLRTACPDLRVVHEGRAAIVDNPVVSLMLSLVKFAAHPGDLFAWRHLQMSPLSRTLDERRLSRETLSLRLLEHIQSEGFRSLLDDWGRALDSECPLDDFGRERLRHLLTAAGEFDAAGSRDCNDFLTFIDKYELHETAADDSVRVMTIHQAKGLGFDVVILPELDDRDMSEARNVPTLVGYDGGAEPAWLLATPSHGVAEADPALAEALQEQHAAAAFESLCLLYVAMTRARHALYVVSSFPGKTARTFDQQAFLKLMLTGHDRPTDGTTASVDGAAATVLYVAGDADWYRASPRRQPAVAPIEPAAPMALGERPSSRARLVAVRPSDHDLFESRAWALFTTDRRESLETGTAVHELLARITWLEEIEPAALEHAWLAAAADRDETVADGALQHFRRAVSMPSLRSVFARPSGNVEVRTEWRFDTVAAGRWLTGSFDRVVVERDTAGRAVAAAIYDFKTDDVDIRGVPARTRLYEQQMLLYRAALERILDLPAERILLRLVFTVPGNVVNVV